MQERRSIYLVDDHPVVRQGLAQLIEGEPDLRVAGCAGDSADALAAIASERPDLVIADLSLPVGDGIEMIRTLRVRFPGLPVLVLTMHEDSFYAERTLRAGARGYLTKQEASEKILLAVRQLLDGGMYVSDRVSPLLLKRLLTGDMVEGEAPLGRLSAREQQVFVLVGQGQSMPEIARELGLSVKTVESYRANARRKLGLADCGELVQYAVRWTIHGTDH